MPDESRRDALDLLLEQMPGANPPAGLAERIAASIQAHHRRRQRLHLALSLGLLLTGAWLFAPALSAALGSLDMPATGLPWLAAWLELALEDAAASLSRLASGLLASGGIPDTLANPAFLGGLAALSLGTLLALEYLLPRRESW